MSPKTSWKSPARPSRGAGSRLAVAALAVALGASPAAGQADGEPEPRAQGWAVLAGQVVSSSTGKPIEGAAVSLLGSRTGAVTDSAGRFRIPRTAAGPDTVAVGYVGYERSTLPLHLEPGKTTRVVLLLSPTVIRLADLVVEVERDRPGALGEFERRRRLGHGHFISREQIEQRNPRQTSDLLREVPGVRVGPNILGRAEVLMVRPATPCPPTVMLDGILVRRFHLDEVPPDDLEGLEIYTGPSRVPAEYAGLGHGCGLVVVWTRRGGGG